MLHSGSGQDDFVTVALPNGIEFFESCFAVWKLGATPQPVSAKLPKFERDQIVELCAPKLVTGVDGSIAGTSATLPIGYQPDPTLSDAPLPERTAESFKAMTSGGSTGRPKLIVSKLPAAWDPQTDYLSFGLQGCVLIPGPLYHNGPFSWAMIALFKGNHVVVTTRFDAQQTLALIEQHRVDVVYMVPTMMQRIWNLPAGDARRLRPVVPARALASGGPLPRLAEGGLHRLAGRRGDLGAVRRHRRPGLHHHPR